MKEDLPKRDSFTTPKVEEVSLFHVPTDVVELPSKGLVYPEDNPLRSGKLEIKYMTAKEEDILTTQSFIQENTVIERFLQSLIVTPGVSVEDLISGDVEALTVAARIHGYGTDYEVKITTPSNEVQTVLVDLGELKLKYLDETKIKEKGVNEFEFELPASKVVVGFKMLTQKELSAYQSELKKDADKKKDSPILKKTMDKLASTQLRYSIVSINGDKDPNTINKYIDSMLAYDARALRKYMTSISPGVDLSVEAVDRKTGDSFHGEFTIGLQFFWPDAEI